jgi:ribosomal protein L11 methylase PrmA
MPDLKRIVKQGGALILSGIIEEKRQDVEQSVKENNLLLVSTEIEPGNGENWVCIVAQK